MNIKEKEMAYKILESREIRSRIQKSLIKKYRKTLISFTLNIPGLYKGLDIYDEIHEVGYKEIIWTLRKNKILIIYEGRKKKETGSEAYIIVDYNSKRIKELMVKIEETHSLGRIFDIDVFNQEFHQISRTELGLDKRKCLLCDNNARTCIREKKHSYKELIENIENVWRDYK